MRRFSATMPSGDSCTVAEGCGSPADTVPPPRPVTAYAVSNTLAEPTASNAQRDAVAAVAGKLADGPTYAHGGVKRLLMMASNDSLESHMEREARQLVQTSRSHDGREGVQAFVQRRRPVFAGR
ncbi:hypothetical protein ACQP0C_18130 [Nocardia sp. CA-129566]|uniref:hypothetical protein n=1 Tax=Nocardia sp. CA-129566 TaxID=3239976 RepID=UPI003D9515D3